MLRSYLVSAVFGVLIFGALLLNLILPDPAILQSERRTPAAFPEFTAKTFFSAEYMGNIGKYAADNFVLRDALRTVRAVSVFDIFMQTDKRGLFYDKNTGAGKFEKLNEASIIKAADKIKKLCAFFPNLDIYFAAIPDKSVYTSRYYPGFDILEAERILSGRIEGASFISLTDVMTGEDFYRTDIHWDQPKLIREGGVLDALCEGIGAPDFSDVNFTVNTAGDFFGVYKGQLALPLSPDTMKYVTCDISEGAAVKYFNPAADAWESGAVYDPAAVNGRDPYDLFLGGVQPLITIENPKAKTNRQLYIFRDSFGSSLAPLLAFAYNKITIIDMRYIDSRVLGQYVDFAEENADVLFLYSSQILNNPDVLLIK